MGYVRSRKWIVPLGILLPVLKGLELREEGVAV
jgi:hypothetical protein